MGAPEKKSNFNNYLMNIFDTMDYGPASEDENIAQAWLSHHNRKLGHFINNKWVSPEGRIRLDSKDKSRGTLLASTIQGENEDIDQAVGAAKKAYESWGQLSGHARARYLYSIARHVQKHSRLLSVLESLDNGKPIRESRDCDIPLVVRHLYYHAGWAQLMDSEMKGWKSVGVVGAIVPWNFPLMLLAWKVCPALAMGNTVVLKPATNTRLSALLFAEICAEAGLPTGVFNVVTGNGLLGSALAVHPLVNKVAFTGSTEVGQLLRRATAGMGKKLSLELGGKSAVIVYDSADIDSAVEGIVDAIWFNQGQVCSAGSRLLVQESIYETFLQKLRHRMSNLRVGISLDKVIDMGAVITETQKKSINEYVEEARKEGAQVFQTEVPSGCFYPPTLISGISSSSRCFYEEIFGPVLVAMSFRTAKEAINLANNSIYGLAASVFTEQMTLAMETAKMIKAGSVWVNCHNLFDSAAGFGGYKQSGFGRDGGKEGLYDYVIPSWQNSQVATPNKVEMNKFGVTYTASGPSFDAASPKIINDDVILPSIDRTYKLYYGGSQKRPDANYSRAVYDVNGKAFALVPEANRKDVRNAVECATKGQPGWEKKSGFNRSQILFYLAENLELRRNEFINELKAVVGEGEAEKEVEGSIMRLFHWASFCDKFGGRVQETQLYGTVIGINEAVGVIGIACPDANPLLSFVSLIAPAIARGNCVVAIASEKFPTLATAFYQILDTSDVPDGVVNILTGGRDHLTKYLTEHEDVNAMWYFGGADGSTFVEFTSAVNVKRTFVDGGRLRNWMDADEGQGEEFILQSTQVKNIWMTMGDIFAN